MEHLVEQLKKVRESLAPEEWRDARIYRHIDEYKLDFTLIATKISSGQLQYYVPELILVATSIWVGYPTL